MERTCPVYTAQVQFHRIRQALGSTHVHAGIGVFSQTMYQGNMTTTKVARSTAYTFALILHPCLCSLSVCVLANWCLFSLDQRQLSSIITCCCYIYYITMISITFLTHCKVAIKNHSVYVLLFTLMNIITITCY